MRPSPSEEYLRLSDIPNDVWLHVRDAVCAGVDMTLVSSRTGVAESWIQARAKKEQWLTPERRQQVIDQYQLNDPEKLARIKDDLSLAAAALSAERVLTHRSFMAELATTKLKEGQADLVAPRTWKEVDIADRVARRAFGLEDGPQTSNIIQIGSLDSSAVEDAPTYDAQVEWEDAEPEDSR